MEVGDVDGIVELDETFVAESFKENHKKVILKCRDLLEKEVNKLKNMV